MIVLKVLFIAVSTGSLLALSVYIYLANRGGNATLYLSDDYRHLSTNQKVFLGLAAIGFLICMFKGAETMLFWLPSEWGWPDEDGEFQSVRVLIASAFAMFGGIALAQFIDNSTHREFFLRDLRAECKELKRVVDASSSVAALDNLKKEYEEVIASLEKALDMRGPIATTTNRDRLPEGQTILRYRTLLSIVQKQKSKITGSCSLSDA
jgi:hypothetical protein